MYPQHSQKAYTYSSWYISLHIYHTIISYLLQQSTALSDSGSLDRYEVTYHTAEPLAVEKRRCMRRYRNR